jgi:hypothetical protein
MSRIYFFATGADLVLVLWHLEQKFALKYVEEGMLAGTRPRIWKTVSDLPHFGEATGDQEIACDPYLITSTDAEIHVLSGEMWNGKLRYDVYPSANPESVLLRRGGRWRNGPLISGHLIASSEADLARKMMNAVRSVVRKHFTRINAFWVGPEALTLFRSGTRLCTAIQSPPEYDLREQAPL